MRLRVSPQNDFVLAEITGLVALDAWDSVLTDLGQAATGAPTPRLVVDLTGLVGWLGLPERHEVGLLMARSLVRFKKVAMHIQPEKIVGTVEAAARGQGLELRMFASREQAVSWALA